MLASIRPGMTAMKKALVAWANTVRSNPAPGPCACLQFRRTSRAVSALYDAFLSSAGLTVTQYALLVSIARERGISRTVLAANLEMDRTTLTRNLRPLERDGFVTQKSGADLSRADPPTNCQRAEAIGSEVFLTGRRRNGLSFPNSAGIGSRYCAHYLEMLPRFLRR